MPIDVKSLLVYFILDDVEVTFMEEEESKLINKTLNDLSVKIDGLNKAIEKTLGEKQEYAEGKINENPLAYIAGAFFGGVVLGYIMSRGKS